jgi:chromosome segregation protein
LETKQESLREEVQANMGEAVESIVNRGPAIVEIALLEQLADQIQKLKYQLSLIGGIDEEVIEEHNQTKEKYDFLTGQLGDLHSATDNLKKMIEELDELMKKKRSTAFKKIRKEFDRYFQILFDGGSAKLEEIYGEPESEEEIEEQLLVGEAEMPVPPVAKKAKEQVLTGIDIIANPPGKKIKNINALSGGERTLTSIALICAILNYNPSPFVVLDEVEAALDEANTMRFTKIMQELSAQSQFIVISHNRVTMHAANALYGVVMKSDGISNMLSVKMEDVPEYEETVDKTPAI